MFVQNMCMYLRMYVHTYIGMYVQIENETV